MLMAAAEFWGGEVTNFDMEAFERFDDEEISVYEAMLAEQETNVVSEQYS